VDLKAAKRTSNWEGGEETKKSRGNTLSVSAQGLVRGKGSTHLSVITPLRERVGERRNRMVN